MEWLSQSSIFSQTPEEFSALLLSPPRQVKIGERENRLHYWVEGGFREGARIHYQLLAGLRRLSWDATITRAKEGGYIVAELASSSTAPFKDFSAVHYIRPFRDNRTLVRDEIEFDATEEVVHFMKTGWSLPSERAASDDDQTAEMRLFGSELG